MKKRIIGLSLVFIMAASPALAAECYVVNKKDDAGKIGDVVISGSGVITPTNPGGQAKGGFIDVKIDVNGDGIGDITLVNDTFLLPSNSKLDPGGFGFGTIPIPEKKAYDGKGVDHYPHE